MISGDMSTVLTLPMTEVTATCTVHGQYLATVLVRDGKPRPAECGICAQALIQVDRDAASREQIEKYRKARRAAMLDRLELPASMLSAVWADYKPINRKAASYHNLCRQYASSWQDSSALPGNITMVGTTGSGKTHLACMMAKQIALESGAKALYTTVARMSRYVRGSFSKDAKYTQTEAFDRYVALDLLVLDEVGLNLSSSFERALIDELVDERAMRRVPTIVISNLSIPELEKLAERMMDRMRDNGTFMIFDWASHRGQNT